MEALVQVGETMVQKRMVTVEVQKVYSITKTTISYLGEGVGPVARVKYLFGGQSIFSLGDSGQGFQPL